MTDSSAIQHIMQSNLQLPIFSYFDIEIYNLEIELLFKQSSGYVGHELMTPNIGDYQTLLCENEGRVLVRNNSGVELLSNICKHRQAIMLKNKGNIQNIVCPLHGWTYQLSGRLLGAPHFQKQPCVTLEKSILQNWNGLLFEGSRDIQQDLNNLSIYKELDFSGYMFDHIEVHDCNYNWKTFIEVYLEDYHVVPFHPGLGKFVECKTLQWQFDDYFSLQTVGIHNELKYPGSKIYALWHQAVLGKYQENLPKYGAIWLLYYPNIMIEWYPSVLCISTVYPIGPRKTKNIIEYYYPEEIVLFEREFIEYEKAAYMETCIEDDEIAERMDAGRESLLKRNTVNQTTFYQSPMEDGMQHFHQWYKKKMNSQIKY